MKKIITLYFIFYAIIFVAHSERIRPQLSLSAGAHLDFYQWQDVYRAPLNLQADILLSERNAVGLGYTYDAYKGDNTFFRQGSAQETYVTISLFVICII